MTTLQLPWPERFWAKVRKSSNCWEWTGAKNTKGYGNVSVWKVGTFKAHRIAWQLSYGPIPDGKCVLHHCDNPGCVRPDHLWLGTNLDNIRDMWKKGRARPGVIGPLPLEKRARGDSHGMAKMTSTLVSQLRAEYENGNTNISHLAVKYGVTRRTIKDALIRKTWQTVA